MTFTKHGHNIPGTPVAEVPEESRPCGGLTGCDECIQESAKVYYNQLNETKEFIQELPLNSKIFVEVALEVQHEKRMVNIGRALVDMEALKKIQVEATTDHELKLVVASHFRFEGK